jgi:hypothetical protein
MKVSMLPNFVKRARPDAQVSTQLPHRQPDFNPL